jgi:hypothetical protein
MSAETLRAEHEELHSAVCKAFTDVLPKAIREAEANPVELSKIMTGYAAVQRVCIAREKLYRQPPPRSLHPSHPFYPSYTSYPPPPSPTDDAQPAPDPALETNAKHNPDWRSEVTYWRGRPAPKKLQGYHPDAPYGRKRDGTPYTRAEFLDVFRRVIRFNWGVECEDFPPTDAKAPADAQNPEQKNLESTPGDSYNSSVAPDTTKDSDHEIPPRPRRRPDP